MVDQYKLRLGDGTVLAVDEQGLRTWLIDGKAMVQRPGSQAWRPLKEILAALSQESAAAPKPLAVAPGPAPALPLVQPSAQPPAPVAAPVSARPPARVVTAALADSIAKPGVKVDDGIPIIPFKRLDDGGAALPATVPTGDLREVAAAALDPEASAGPWQWAGSGPRTDAGVTAAAVPRDQAPAPRAARPDVPTTPVKTTGPNRLVPAEGEVLVRQGPIDPRAIVYPPVPGEQAVRAAVEWGKDVVTKGREQIAHLPTPPIPELPRITEALASPAARTRLRRAIVPAVSLAGAVVLGLSAWAWWSQDRPAETQSTPSPASQTLPPPPVEPSPEYPKEVLEAMAQLPHLAPDTIQLVMASGHTPTANPPELFRRAYVASSRGTSALTDDEARELRALMNGVLGALRRVDRDRVRAYGRLTTQRDLLVQEDRKVLSLFARGVRALPAARRERLQELSGKAIAAGLPPRMPGPGTSVVAP